MDNTEKNTYVKKQITKALLDLLKDKELKDISVSEFAGAACVSRNSFYRNYCEKEDILRGYIFQLFGEWTAEYDKHHLQSDDEMITYMFAHLCAYRDFYMLLCERKLLYLLKDVLKEIIGPKPAYPNPDAYATAFIFSGIFGWIEEWLNRGMQESAEEMKALLKNRENIQNRKQGGIDSSVNG
jgi:AcrR family transcriptional regulator